MYEGLTPETIKEEILSRIAYLDTREGSFANDMVSAVAYEIWKVYQSLNAVIPIAFVDETSGEYIDRRAGEYGITRKPGTKARAKMTFTGKDGTIVPKGKVFQTADGLQFEVEKDVTIAGGAAEGTVVAAEAGAKYNVEAGEISLQLYALNGMESFTNEAAAGGTDPETDAALLARLNEFRRNTATSGNAAHYRQWALSVDGVGAAKVYPLWDGPGTVKVVIAGPDMGPVDNAVVQACAAYIEENRPIGAEVTVVSAIAKTINVTAKVVLDGSVAVSDVQSAFEKALTEYLHSIAFDENTIIYNRVAYMLLGIKGVQDFSVLTVNGGTANISLGADEVPVLGSVVVTA